MPTWPVLRGQTKKPKRKPVMRLSLANRKLEAFPHDELMEFPSLRSLSLERCGLRSVPRMALFELANLSWKHSLVKLYMQDNQLQTLPREISLLGNLSVLNLSGNQLDYLPDEIGQLTKLKKLNVTANHLRELPHTIVHLTSLKSLRASKNHMYEIPWEVASLTSLREISFENNPIVSPPPEVCFMGFTAVISYLENPPLFFDCVVPRLDELEQCNLILTNPPPETAASIKARLYKSNPKYEDDANILFYPTSFRAFLKVALGRMYFTDYLRKRRSLEYLQFYDSLSRFLRTISKQTEESMMARARGFYETYVSAYADEQILLPSALVQRVGRALTASTVAVDVIHAAYTKVLREVGQHLSRACFPEFLASPDYETCLLHFCDLHCGRTTGQSPRKLTQNVDLHHLLEDTEERNAFAEFLKREFSLENLLFWEAVVKLRHKTSLPRSEISKQTRRIYDMFLSGEGAHDITLPGEERERLRLIFSTIEEGGSGTSASNKDKRPPLGPSVFDTALDTVEQVLCFDSLPRYIASQPYMERRARKQKQTKRGEKRGVGGRFSFRHMVDRKGGDSK